MSDEYDSGRYDREGNEVGGSDAPPPVQERTFAALPPARGRGFAESWWGRAWLKALEDTALDGEQLKKGRGSPARAGSVRLPSGPAGSPRSSGTGTRPRTAVMCSSRS